MVVPSGTDQPAAAVLGTLDTKAQELDFIAARLREAGVRPLVIDVGVKGKPGLAADVSREEVAAAGGAKLPDLAAGKLPANDALQAMGRGAGVILLKLAGEGKIAGVLAIGGGRGTAVTSTALRVLPFGFPKIIVSTAAAGETRRFLGTRDIMIVSPVTDLLGLNRINRAVLSNAAAAMVGMVSRDRVSETPPPKATTVGMTCIGVTSPAVEACKKVLEGHGLEVLVFHARGPGGQAMEELIREGAINAVVDLSLTEMMNELVGGIAGAGPKRLEAAGDMGIPQVVLPGGIDIVNFGPPETVPPSFSGRLFHRHSQSATLMRSDVAENARLGKIVGQKLSRSRAPVAVLVPQGGVSTYDVPGGPFWWPEADQAFTEALFAEAAPTIHKEAMPQAINSETVAQRAASLILDMCKER